MAFCCDFRRCLLVKTAQNKDSDHSKGGPKCFLDVVDHDASMRPRSLYLLHWQEE